MKRPLNRSHIMAIYDVIEKNNLHGRVTPITSHEDGKAHNIRLEINLRDAVDVERFIVALDKI